MTDTASAHPLQIELGGSHGPVSGLLSLPSDAMPLYVLAHGAGAGMRHQFLEAMARALHAVGIGTLLAEGIGAWALLRLLKVKSCLGRV